MATTRRNNISNIRVKEELVEENARIKDHVVNFFRLLYTDPKVVKLRLDGLNFNQLDDFSTDWLESPFSEDEVKNAIWDSDVPEPDGFTMAFYKEC